MSPLEFPRRWQRGNAHAHSTFSDGQLTPQQIAELGERKKTLIWITDHNSVDAHRDFSHPYSGPGCEVTTEEHVDILIYHEREKLVDYFDRKVRPHLDKRDPQYSPSRKPALELVEEVIAEGGEVVIPHMANVEGLLRADQHLINTILRLPVIVELNGRSTLGMNRTAKKVANQYNKPIIACGDSHMQSPYPQYTSSTTKIPIPKDTEHPMEPMEFLRSIRMRQTPVSFSLSPMSALESLKMTQHLITHGGLSWLRSIVRNSGTYAKRLITSPTPLPPS